jgi:hypothetical protein
MVSVSRCGGSSEDLSGSSDPKSTRVAAVALRPGSVGVLVASGRYGARAYQESQLKCLDCSAANGEARRQRGSTPSLFG